MSLAPWQRLCSRCSMLADGSGSQLCALCFNERARAVYWDRSTKACRFGGRNHAECLLAEGHSGPHEGNGFDEYGPVYRRWNEPRKRDAVRQAKGASE